MNTINDQKAMGEWATRETGAIVPAGVPPDGPPVSTTRHDRWVHAQPHPAAMLHRRLSSREGPSAAILTTQENLYDATRGAAVPQRRRCRRTGSIIQRRAAPLTRCARGLVPITRFVPCVTVTRRSVAFRSVRQGIRSIVVSS